MTAVIDDAWQAHADSIERIATRAWSRFRDYVELDDLRQVAWLTYFSNRHSYDEMLSNESEYWRRTARANISRHVRDYALREKAARIGYEVDDQYFYSRGELKAVLPVVFLGGVTPAAIEPGKIKRRGASTYMDMETAVVDVRQALARLDQSDRQALYEAWGPDVTEVSRPQFSSGGVALGRLQRELGERPPARISSDLVN